MKRLCALLLFFFTTLAFAADSPTYKYQRLGNANDPCTEVDFIQPFETTCDPF